MWRLQRSQFELDLFPKPFLRRGAFLLFLLTLSMEHNSSNFPGKHVPSSLDVKEQQTSRNLATKDATALAGSSPNAHSMVAHPGTNEGFKALFEEDREELRNPTENPLITFKQERPWHGTDAEIDDLLDRSPLNKRLRDVDRMSKTSPSASGDGPAPRNDFEEIKHLVRRLESEISFTEMHNRPGIGKRLVHLSSLEAGRRFMEGVASMRQQGWEAQNRAWEELRNCMNEECHGWEFRLRRHYLDSIRIICESVDQGMRDLRQLHLTRQLQLVDFNLLVSDIMVRNVPPHEWRVELLNDIMKYFPPRSQVFKNIVMNMMPKTRDTATYHSFWNFLRPFMASLDREEMLEAIPDLFALCYNDSFAENLVEYFAPDSFDRIDTCQSQIPNSAFAQKFFLDRISYTRRDRREKLLMGILTRAATQDLYERAFHMSCNMGKPMLFDMSARAIEWQLRMGEADIYNDDAIWRHAPFDRIFHGRRSVLRDTLSKVRILEAHGIRLSEFRIQSILSRHEVAVDFLCALLSVGWIKVLPAKMDKSVMKDIWLLWGPRTRHYHSVKAQSRAIMIIWVLTQLGCHKDARETVVNIVMQMEGDMERTKLLGEWDCRC